MEAPTNPRHAVIGTTGLNAMVSENQSRWAAKAGPLRVNTKHRAFIAAARLTPGMRVLDLATGRGEIAVLAAAAGCVVHATDVNPALVEAARRNAGEAGVTITTSVADMRDLGGLPGHFDVVLGCAALHHLDEAGARRAVAEAIRVLRPEGRAIFLEPVENVRWFDFIKHCFSGPMGRPSILNRGRWRSWLKERDDRWMSDAELLNLWRHARIIGRFGLLRRIGHRPLIERADAWLLASKALAPYAQAAIVEYRL